MLSKKKKKKCRYLYFYIFKDIKDIIIISMNFSNERMEFFIDKNIKSISKN